MNSQFYNVIVSPNEDKEGPILFLSRGISVILLLDCFYLWFQLRTHHNLFDGVHHEDPEATQTSVEQEGAARA